ERQRPPQRRVIHHLPDSLGGIEDVGGGYVPEHSLVVGEAMLLVGEGDSEGPSADSAGWRCGRADSENSARIAGTWLVCSGNVVVRLQHRVAVEHRDHC